MRRLIIAACGTGSLIIFIITSRLIDTLFLFVLFGILPGTDIVLTAGWMLLGWCIFFAALLRHWFALPLRRLVTRRLLTR